MGKPKYQLQAKNETGDKTIDIQSFTVPDSSITAGSGIVNIATATGDVTGPSSSTDNALVRFDSTTGKVIQNSSITVSDSATDPVMTAATTLTINTTNAGAFATQSQGTYTLYANSSAVFVGASADTGFSRIATGVARVVNGSAAASWLQTGGNSRVTTNVTTVSITPADITGLSATLIAGRTYAGRLVVMCAAATAADGFRFDFDGGAATATDFRAMGTIADTASVRPLAMTSALATDLVDTTTTGDAIAVIDFTITCNAAGTFIPRFAKEADAAGATNTVYRGSYMLITDVA